MIDDEFKLATLRAMDRTVGRCDRCGLCKTRNRVVVGQGLPSAVVMFIGEAPGENEDREGLPFVGRAGQYLKKLFRETGGQGQWCYITNTVKCRPPDNRKPTQEEMAACRTWLLSQIAVIKPRIIVCVGQIAAQAMLKTKRTAKLGDLRGRWFDGDDGKRVRVIHHPSFLMQYGREYEARARADLTEIWAEARKIVGEKSEQHHRVGGVPLQGGEGQIRH